MNSKKVKGTNMANLISLEFELDIELAIESNTLIRLYNWDLRL